MSKPHHRSLWCITNNERLALDLGWEWKKDETRKYIYDDRLSALFISWVINWCILFSVCMHFSHLFDPYFVNSCVMVGIVMVSWNYFLHFINNKTTAACWILSIIFNILLGIKDNDKQDCLIESFIDLYFVIKIFNIILNFFFEYENFIWKHIEHMDDLYSQSTTKLLASHQKLRLQLKLTIWQT